MIYFHLDSAFPKESGIVFYSILVISTMYSPEDRIKLARLFAEVMEEINVNL